MDFVLNVAEVKVGENRGLFCSVRCRCEEMCGRWEQAGSVFSGPRPPGLVAWHPCFGGASGWSLLACLRRAFLITTP